jgi:hypothetical protein
MRHNITPYPQGVRIKNIADGAQVFFNERYLGDVEQIENWGDSWRAKGQCFSTKTEAVLHLLNR